MAVWRLGVLLSLCSCGLTQVYESTVGGSAGTVGNSTGVAGTTGTGSGVGSGFGSSLGATAGTVAGTGSLGSGTSGTSGTTGSLCSPEFGSCLVQSCCLGLSCDQFNGQCLPEGSFNGAASGATGGGSIGATGGSSGGPCTPSGLGGACETSIDCLGGLICDTDAGGCELPEATIAQCTRNGSLPSNAPCCESTSSVDQLCIPFTACALERNACNGSIDCCSGLQCAGATCVPSCGSLLTACLVDSDCCLNQGLSCTPGATLGLPPTSSFCFPSGLASQADPAQPGTNFFCTNQQLCQAFDAGFDVIECQLGATCDAAASGDGGVDACAAVGLVCDSTSSVCRAPELFEACVQGAQNCQPQANATAPVACVDGNVFGLGSDLCDQACSQTSDCILPGENCITQQQIDLCASNSCTAAQFYQPCPSAGTSDGLCAPLGGFGQADFEGLCEQGDGDAGPGSLCNVNGNRQIGGLCDTGDVCITGVCGAVCNSGTSGTPACPAGQACVSAVGFFETSDPQDFGGCVTPCDFTQLDGGGCGFSLAGLPTKCLPSELEGYGPQSGTPIVDFCAPLAASPIAIGSDCSGAPASDALDPCVVGALCYAPVLGASSTCEQLCENEEIGAVGPSGGCPSGETCTAVSFSTTASAHTGVCL